MTVYIDEEFRCHAQAEHGLKAAETAFFDGLCDEMTECYRFVPEGQTWTREDGAVFPGEMMTPYKDTREARAAQRVYDEMKNVAGEYAAAYAEGVQSA